MADRVASLPMYDLPEVRAATDAWWRGLAQHFSDVGIAAVPTRLTRGGEGAAFWLRPDLLFSQTCGYPLVTSLAGRVTPVATPEYEFDGCAGPHYCSHVIVADESAWTRLEELRGGRCAVNALDSWSGHQALRRLCAPLAPGGRFFSETLIAGSHRNSIDMVRRRVADVAAIDAVTHGLLSRHAPSALRGVRVLVRTPPAPGLPYIAGSGVSRGDCRRMRAALETALGDSTLDGARHALGITGATLVPPEAYGRLVRPAA